MRVPLYNCRHKLLWVTAVQPAEKPPDQNEHLSLSWPETSSNAKHYVQIVRRKNGLLTEGSFSDVCMSYACYAKVVSQFIFCVYAF